MVLTNHICDQIDVVNVQQSIFFTMKSGYPLPNIKTTSMEDLKTPIISFKKKTFNFRASLNNYGINVVNKSFFKLPRCSIVTCMCLVMDVSNLIQLFRFSMVFYKKDVLMAPSYLWILPYGWHIIHLIASIPCTSLLNSSFLITKNVNATYSN